jgi:hypothetical protein
MADLNRHLKNNKILVFFTIIVFLYMSCFTSCSKPKNREKAETAQKSARIEKGDEPRAGYPPGVDASAENAGQKKPLTQEELNQMADKLDRYFLALEEAVKEIPRDTFDPQAMVDKIGKDPEALFRWVKDNTYWVPYQGALRGPVGVLMDRLGNSLDRSLLLAKLLQEAGYRVQLAHARIPEEQAKEIKKNMRSIPQDRYSVQGSSRGSLEEVVGQFTNKYGLDQEEYQKSLRAAELESKAMIEKSNNLIKTQSKWLEELVGIPQQAKNLADEEKSYGLQCLGDHWWVQLSRDNQWLDFDLLHPDMTSGKALAPVETTSQPDEINEESIHKFEVRVIIEKWSEGAVKENIVFQHSLRPLELVGEPIVLAHSPMNWPTDLNLLNEKDPLGKFRDVARDEKEWLPCLVLGQKQIFQSSFTDSGDVNANPGKKDGGSVGGIAKGLVNAFGGEEEETAGQQAFLSAEWIEYEIHIPGKPNRIVRREIFDLLGPSVRAKKNFGVFQLDDTKKADRGLALLGSVEILPLTGHLAPEFISYLAAKRLVESKVPFLSFLKLDEGSRRAKSGELVALLKNISSPLSALELARQTLGPYSYFHYLDCLNIFNFRAGYSQDANGKVRPFEFIDIVLNPVTMAGPDANSFSGRIRQGVVDTVSEAVIYDRQEAVENTAILFEKALKAGAQGLTLNPQQQKDIPELGLPQDASARLSETLGQGYLAVVLADFSSAQAPGDFGWWRVDPKSGETIGVMGSGFNKGGQTPEYTKILEKIVTIAQSLKPYFGGGDPGTIGLENIQKLAAYMWQRGVMSPGTIMVLVGCGIVVGIFIGIVIGLGMGG